MTLSFDSERAYAHIQALAETIGPRQSGTPEEEQALAYIREALRSYGLQPEIQEFDTDCETIISAKLEIMEPGLGETQALPLVGTPDTPPGGINAELVFAEHPLEPYTGPHISGKIVVLANGGSLGKELRSLLKYKPAGLILVGHTLSQVPNTFRMVLKGENKPFEMVPTMHIRYEDALRLWNAGAARACMTLETQRSQGKSRNVVAEVKGTALPDEIILIGGHLDTIPKGPGATDNAAGVATVLELARLFAERGSRRTLRFAAWGSEEGGLAGSIKYVMGLKKKDKTQREGNDYIEGYSKTDLEKHLLNINLDVLGMSLGYNAFYSLGPQSLGNYAKSLTDELGVHHRVGSEPYLSDNLSFLWGGVPSVSFVREGTAAQYMHTSRDDISLIDVCQLGIIGNLVDVFIARTAAQGIIWPFERQVPPLPPEIQQTLQNHLREVVAFLGEDLSVLA